MEGLVALGLAGLLVAGIEERDVTAHVNVFALDYLSENLYLMMAMSGVFAALRVTGAIALWRNRLWGVVTSLVMCLTTLTLMVFLLPAGIADGILSGAALLLILRGWLTSDNGTPRPAVP